MDITLSSDAEKALKLIERIDQLTQELGDVYADLSEKENMLVGGIVIGICSPVNGFGSAAKFGNEVVCDGMIDKMGAGSFPSLGNFLSDRE